MLDQTSRETRGVSLHLGDQPLSHLGELGQPQLLDTRVICSHPASVMLKAGPDLQAILERGRSSLKSDFKSRIIITHTHQAGSAQYRVDRGFWRGECESPDSSMPQGAKWEG